MKSNMNYTVIVKIKTTMEQAAQECLDQLGEGANPDATQVEAFFALNNTPDAGGYCRVVVAEHIAIALQYMFDSGIESEHVEIIRVEWAGQDKVAVEKPILDDEGNDTGETETVYETQLFQVGTEDVTDEQGNIIDQRPVYLGRMA
jgi:hypothetical protein